MKSTARERTCIIGAGCSGLAALRAVARRGIAVDCFERGSDVGGNWRYENDSGTSSAYASLHTNVSRPRMQFPSFPMPKSYGDFVHHTDMARYFEAYADRFGLNPHIRYGTNVERVEPHGGQWQVTLSTGETRRYRWVVVANGHDWAPRW